LILDATSVGELVLRIAAKGAKGRVRRLFRSSAYLETRGGLVLLLRGTLKSPMTVNVADGPNFIETLSVEDVFEAKRSELRIGETRIRLGGAEPFRSGLLEGKAVEPISAVEIARCASALKLLYSASEASLDLVSGRAFDAFADRVLRPLAAGRSEQAHRFPNYVGLLGSGTGFTPAGDDFVAGFTAAFNFRARGSGITPIHLPLKEIRKRTVGESAFLVDYAQRGYVDEGLQQLILAGFGGKPLLFRAQLSELASRGHTSGLDMSLGVLMFLACVSDRTKRGRTLESALGVLGD
jgi:uncharacterized protein DUF2877